MINKDMRERIEREGRQGRTTHGAFGGRASGRDELGFRLFEIEGKHQLSRTVESQVAGAIGGV